jgi:hypothetical protein
VKRATVILAFVLAATVAIPATAAAKPGWRLPTATSEAGGQVFKSKATHCGASQFGSYLFRNSVKSKRFFGFVLFRVAILQNAPGESFGPTSEPKFLRFGGDLPRRLKKQTRSLLNNVLFRYAVGPPALVESIFPNGTQQAARAFNPVPTRC